MTETSSNETERQRSDNFRTFVTSKQPSSSSDDSSVVFKIPVTSRRSQSPPSSASSGEEMHPRLSWKKKLIAEYMSNDQLIHRSS
ncbi:hypothetical protein TNCT_310651 [Trichonephila clavata]|uniref:Uncharacterized protein n=1 Tax=Trichonephila clavata TaxID=2740835 RepID=A0A8X6FDT8_TRICU|nr:hypothetical protein TNCT_310651 [Trichonephila clavata]